MQKLRLAGRRDDSRVAELVHAFYELSTEYYELSQPKSLKYEKMTLLMDGY